MKMNTTKRIITIATALSAILAIGTCEVCAQSGGNGTVKDGKLFWLKNAGCFDRQTWDQAKTSVKNLKTGACGLTDGSKAGDWRLPTIDELSKRAKDKRGFTNVATYFYWSSSINNDNANSVWVVDMGAGNVNGFSKTGSVYVWPVRDAK